MGKKRSDNSANRSQGYNPKSGGGAKSKNMAEEIRNSELGKAAKRSKRPTGRATNNGIFTGKKEVNLAGALDPTSIIKPPVKPGAHREWHMRGSKIRRCQHFDGKKQCRNKAVKGFFTCSAHGRLEQAVRTEIKAPYGPTWMKRLKRNVKRWFNKDLDFWSTLELEQWAKASDVIDVALSRVPERAEELYKVLEEPSDEGLRPAARLARAMLREKFMLSPSQEGKLPDREAYLYTMWKSSEFYAIFGYNGGKAEANKDDVPVNPLSPPPDNRTRAELKLAFPSLSPEGQIMFLEVKAIDAETRLFGLTKQLPRDTFGKTPLDAKISDLYYEVESIKAETACMIVIPPATANRLSKLERELDELVEQRKSTNQTLKEAKQVARSLRERQAQLLGGSLDRPERLYYKFSTLKGEKDKAPKNVGNRGRHAGKHTSKRRIGKGTAGSGHNASLRGRFSGSSPTADWDKIIADNSRIAALRASQPTRKSDVDAAPIIVPPAVTAPVVLPPKVDFPSVMIPVG